MTKLILVLSSIGLALTLLLGMYDPSNSMMWLASTTQTFTIVRAGLLLVIFSLLVTDPPRNVYLRAIVGLLSVVTVGATAGAFYNNHMQVLDAFLLMAIGISSGITVLERKQRVMEVPIETLIKETRTKKHARRKLATA